MIIESRQNPTIKRLKELREAKARREQGLFLIDTPRDIERALQCFISGKIKIITAYHCSDFPTEESLLEKLKSAKIPLQSVNSIAFESICYRENPSGLILEAATWSTDLSTLTLKNPTLIILAEDIEKPGNLGTLLRTADAVGAQAIIGCNNTVELFNPNTLRASAGAAFSVPYATATLSEALAWIAQHKLMLLATSPAAKKKFWQADLKVPLAIAIGSEANGLSKELMEAAKDTVSLPMNGIGDSLNVSVATGALLYEVLRQRSAI